MLVVAAVVAAVVVVVMLGAGLSVWMAGWVVCSGVCAWWVRLWFMEPGSVRLTSQISSTLIRGCRTRAIKGESRYYELLGTAAATEKRARMTLLCSLSEGV